MSKLSGSWGEGTPRIPPVEKNLHDVLKVYTSIILLLYYLYLYYYILIILPIYLYILSY